jgi:hypothetical protein
MPVPDPNMTEVWLRSLAEDVLEHEGCDGCKYNAATALEHLGILDEILAQLGIADPRTPRHPSASATDAHRSYGSRLGIAWDDPPLTE